MAGLELDQFNLEYRDKSNALWIGNSPKALATKIIRPGEVAGVPFYLDSSHFGLESAGEVSGKYLEDLGIHVRSRYAHLGLNVGERELRNILGTLDSASIKGSGIGLIIPIMNLSSRPVRVNEGFGVFSLFHIPESAYIRGHELERMVGNKSDKSVFIQGEEGEDWKFIYNENVGGFTTGLFLRLQDWYYIPASDEEVDVSNFSTFKEFRSWFERNSIHHKYPHLEVPNQLLIAKGPNLILAPNICLRLGSEVFLEDDKGNFRRFAEQTASPIIDGIRTAHRPHFEVANRSWESLDGRFWIGVTAVRDGSMVKKS